MRAIDADALEKEGWRLHRTVSVDSHTMEYQVKHIAEVPTIEPEQYGWVCPVCGRGLSPLTMVCPCNNGKGWEITCKT